MTLARRNEVQCCAILLLHCAHYCTKAIQIFKKAFVQVLTNAKWQEVLDQSEDHRGHVIILCSFLCSLFRSHTMLAVFLPTWFVHGLADTIL